MRCFITGATGFVGRHFVEYLQRSHPMWKLSCLVRSREKASFLEKSPVHLLQGDLLDPQSYAGILAEVDIVYHMAALVGLKNGPAFYEANTQGMRCLLAALSKNKVLRRFVYVSSISAVDRPWGEQSPLLPLDESSSFCPNTDYGKSKRIAEELLITSGLPYTILRPSYIYGPYPRPGSSMDRVFHDVLSGKGYTRFPYPGRASEIYVKDLVEVMRLVGQSSEAENQEFFVSNPQPVCVSDFFQDVAHFLGVRYEPYVLSEARIKRIQKRCYRERPDDLVMRILFEDYFVCRSKKLYETINCQPTTGYRRGLEETVRWYQEHVFHSHNFIN